MVTQTTIDFVKQHEGCSLTAYQDQGGVWTIGYGHTGPEVHKGLVWTQAQADAALNADLTKAEAQVMKQVTVALSDKQKAALDSFVFNLGGGALSSSHLLQCVNAKDWVGAAKEFIRWDHVGQTEVKGLLIRRLDEAALFLRGS